MLNYNISVYLEAGILSDPSMLEGLTVLHHIGWRIRKSSC